MILKKEKNQSSKRLFLCLTFRLMRGNPCPGAGGRAGRGPFGGLNTEELTEVVVFRLNGFSLQVR